MTSSEQNNKIGPDPFGFYTSEVAELLSQDEGFMPFSDQQFHLDGVLHEVSTKKGKAKSSCSTKEVNEVNSALLYYDAIGPLLSDYTKERMRSLLRQSVFTLSQKVDEVLNPVISIHRLRSCLRYKESLSSHVGLAHKSDQPQRPQKKLKALPSSLDSGSEHLGDDVIKKCAECDATETPQWRHGPDGTKSLCNACGLRFMKDTKRGSTKLPDDEGERETAEIDDDVRFILENDDSTKVEELLNNHSRELSVVLQHMEHNLEELLDIVMISCRPMTINEKQHLRKSIQNLPPGNVDHVAEIVAHSNPTKKYSGDEVHVDLDDEDKVTLWRLYFYVAAVENARKQ